MANGVEPRLVDRRNVRLRLTNDILKASICSLRIMMMGCPANLGPLSHSIADRPMSNYPIEELCLETSPSPFPSVPRI